MASLSREPSGTALHFTVDAALLRELGERLVGRHHIALAELIKNGYDADARHVVVSINETSISVEDDGHGMTLREFTDYWMRIGTPHKQKKGFSRTLGRPLTGSKGIGRLAAQFLGKRISLNTVATNSSTELIADVDWNRAVRAGELTKAFATHRKQTARTKFCENSRNGTRIVVTALNDAWTEDDVYDLARELWTLQPPFKARDMADPRAFEVTLRSENDRFEQIFRTQIDANLNLWSARISGSLEPQNPTDPAGTRTVLCGIKFRDAESMSHRFSFKDCLISSLSFDIRVFSLHGRQKFGIAVQEARDYLKDFGGIHIFDAGFHLPYYGPDVDWLGIEIDHSHRLSLSKFLPPDLQLAAGLNYLPTNSRLYGVVNIDTSGERRANLAATDRSVGKFLEIQASRDRLVDNAAYAQLHAMVRTCIDYYATRQSARVARNSEVLRRQDKVVATRTRDVRSILGSFQNQIPATVFAELSEALSEYAQQTSEAAREFARGYNLLGSLATAGINAIALEHETGKQLTLLERFVEELRSIDPSLPDSRKTVASAAENLTSWLERARAIRALFVPLMDEDDRTLRVRLNARAVIGDIVNQVHVLMRGVMIDFQGINSDLLLPSGTISEWSSIFQNIMINAGNAMIDEDAPRIAVRSVEHKDQRSIIVEDNGSGVKLDTSEKLFEPFERAAEISMERRALGLGGTGLGLTIVRMIATNIGCTVRFVEPSEPYSTAFELAWSEFAK